MEQGVSRHSDLGVTAEVKMKLDAQVRAAKMKSRRGSLSMVIISVFLSGAVFPRVCIFLDDLVCDKEVARCPGGRGGAVLG